MIPADTKCVIKKVPGESTFSHLLGGNGDSGFVVEPK